MDNNKWYPESRYDTLMACFCSFLAGVETYTARLNLRMRLMNRMRDVCKGDELFTHPAVQALVLRLHAISPKEIPRSAEIFYLRDAQRMRRECATFIAQNRRMGYVGDKYTFYYLFSDLFNVTVREGEQPFSAHADFDCKYTLSICHEGHRFHLELPTVPIRRPSHLGAADLLPPPRMASLRLPTYDLLPDKRALFPPAVRDYRVHWCILHPRDGGCVWSLTQRKKRWPAHGYYVYVWVEDNLGGLDLVSCASDQGKTGPHFLLSKHARILYVVEEQNVHEAERAVRVEKSWLWLFMR